MTRFPSIFLLCTDTFWATKLPNVGDERSPTCGYKAADASRFHRVGPTIPTGIRLLSRVVSASNPGQLVDEGNVDGMEGRGEVRTPDLRLQSSFLIFMAKAGCKSTCFTIRPKIDHIHLSYAKRTTEFWAICGVHVHLCVNSHLPTIIHT